MKTTDQLIEENLNRVLSRPCSAMHDANDRADHLRDEIIEHDANDRADHLRDEIIERRERREEQP